MRSLFSCSNIPQMQVTFMPFLPIPVTDPSTIYTALRNFIALIEKLQQNNLPVTCDEGVFRRFLKMFLQKQDEFQYLLPMLGGSNMAKCALGDSLLELQVFGIKDLISVISGTNDVRAIQHM